MAKFDDNSELAGLIKKYTVNRFVPYVLPTPDHHSKATTPEQRLEIVRRISENAVNRIRILCQ